MTYRDLTYMILDEIKAISDDSIITEEHVIFLLNTYRPFLIKLKKDKQGLESLSQSNYLTICLDLEETKLLPGEDVCSETILKSVLKVPDTIDDITAKIYPKSYFKGINISYVSRDRFKYVGFNRFMQNIIYATLGIDHHLYLKSINPLFMYMEGINMSAIFEDAEEANKYSCEAQDTICDILDASFSIDADLVPLLIEIIVKELTAAAWRQADNLNNAADDLADLIAYISRNTKSALAKQIAE